MASQMIRTLLTILAVLLDNRNILPKDDDDDFPSGAALA